jgi:hypothetical protein
MDFWPAFWIAIVMGIVSWVAIKLGHSSIAAALGLIGSGSVIVPILIIAVMGVFKINSVSGIEEMTKITNQTITDLFQWLGDNIQSIIAGDVAGWLLGAIFSIFR